MAIIYKATNVVNNKVYIGQSSVSLEHRLNNAFCGHFVRAFEQESQSCFHVALRKYGKDKFTFEVLEEKNFEVKEDMQNWLNEKERFWIEKYNSTNRQFGYNSTLGGQDSQVWSEEKRIAHAERLSKWRLSEKDLSNKISIGVRKHYEEHPETRQKIGEKSSEFIKSMTVEEKQEWCSKISKSTSISIKEKYKDDTYRQRQKEGVRKRFEQRGVTEEHKANISKSMLNTKLMYKDGKGKRVPISEVKQYELMGYEYGHKAGRRQKNANF